MAESKGFTKSDMERVGLFQEMGYTTIDDRYKDGGRVSFNEGATKGKQMLPGGVKSRSALQAGYFSDKFTRVMENEAYSDPRKIRRQYRLKESQKNIGKAFLPSNGDKLPSGLGNHYGTLSGPVSAFSAQNKPDKPYKTPGRNVYSNPGKKGTGFGYVGVTIGKYEKHQTDEYERARDMVKKEIELHRRQVKGGAFKLNMHPQSYFDGNPYRNERALPPIKKTDGKPPDVKPFKPSSPAKAPGGSKAGTFDAYPNHSVNAYNVKNVRPVHVVNKSGKIFMPSACPKSAPILSIVNHNVNRELNITNYKEPSSIMAF